MEFSFFEFFLGADNFRDPTIHRKAVFFSEVFNFKTLIFDVLLIGTDANITVYHIFLIFEVCI